MSPDSHLLLGHSAAADLADVAVLLSDALGGVAFEERESAHYVDHQYFMGTRGAVEFRVAVEDLGHHGWPWRLCVTFGEASESEAAIRAGEVARACLLPAGFRVAQIVRFNRPDEDWVEVVTGSPGPLPRLPR